MILKNLMQDIDEAINNGIDILKNVEQLFQREFVSDESDVQPRDIRTSNNAEKVKVFSIRTEGKRVPGRQVVIYVSSVASTLLYFYK